MRLYHKNISLERPNNLDIFTLQAYDLCDGQKAEKPPLGKGRTAMQLEAIQGQYGELYCFKGNLQKLCEALAKFEQQRINGEWPSDLKGRMVKATEITEGLNGPNSTYTWQGAEGAVCLTSSNSQRFQLCWETADGQAGIITNHRHTPLRLIDEFGPDYPYRRLPAPPELEPQISSVILRFHDQQWRKQDKAAS